jgi:hypothetical protein
MMMFNDIYAITYSISTYININTYSEIYETFHYEPEKNRDPVCSAWHTKIVSVHIRKSTILK